MSEDELGECSKELEGLLIETCKCVLIGTEEINQNQCDTLVDKIRPFFVSTLESRIYALLGKFVYSEDADRFHEQFPDLKKCIHSVATTSGPAIESCSKYMGPDILQDAIKGTMKYFIKEGIFTAFINSVVFNNRINRICRELDALGIEKTCLRYVNVWNFVCEKDYWTVDSCQHTSDDNISDLVVEVGTENQECLPCKNLKRSSCDPKAEDDYETETSSVCKIKRVNSNPEVAKTSVCFSDKKMGAEHLRLSITKVQFSVCGCVDVVRPKKFRRLKLPCKSEDLIKMILKVDKSHPHSCLIPIRKKFEEAVHNISSCLNDVLNRTERTAIKSFYLLCEIRPGYVSFKLKSIQSRSCGSKPCLFSARVATCRSVSQNQISFRKSFRKSFMREDQQKFQRKQVSDKTDLESSSPETSRQNYLSDDQEKEEEIYVVEETECGNIQNSRADCCESCLSSIEEKEEETNIIKGIECGNIENSRANCCESCLSGVEKKEEEINITEGTELGNIQISDTSSKRETNSKITVQAENSNDSGSPNVTCSCGHVSADSRNSFFKIEMKLRNVSECFRKPALKEGESDLKAKEELKTTCCQKAEIEHLKEFGEPDLNKPVTCTDLQNLIKFPKEPEASECDCGAKEDQNLVKSKVSDCKVVPDGQEPTECRKDVDILKSQIPIRNCSLQQLSQISTIRKCGTRCSKIPIRVKEKPPVSSCRESSSSLVCKTRLVPNENPPTLRKRVTRQNCQKFSIRQQMKKSDHLVEAAASSKYSNLTYPRSFSSSVTTMSKPPKPAKRNLVGCSNPPPNSSSPTQQIDTEYSKFRESVCSKPFVKDRPATSLLEVYQRNPEMAPHTTYIIVTDSDEVIDQCNSNCACHASLNRLIRSLETPDDTNCHQKPKTREEVKLPPQQVQLLEKQTRSTCRTISVQTLEQKMESKGINVNIKESREFERRGLEPGELETRKTVSKAANIDRKTTLRKGVNIDLIPKDSFISLQSNVTKIISVFDITIFEEGFEKSLKKPLNCNTVLQMTCPKRNTCQGTTSVCCSKREKNPKFHLRSDCNMNSDLSDEFCKEIPKIKVRSNNRRHRMSGIDSWVLPSKVKAQNIINAICDPFSNESIKRIKYLIRTKLGRMLLGKDSNEGSKTFVSSKRYYVSASSEKTCCSPVRKISLDSSKKGSSNPESYKSENSNLHCRDNRMTGGTDNLLHECPIRIGSGWEFDGGDEDFFLIRKRRRFSEGREVKTPKEKELRIYKEKDVMFSKEEIRTSNGKVEGRYNKYSSFGSYPDPIRTNELAMEERSQNKSMRRDEERKRIKENMSPGDVITSCHLGRRYEKILRKRSFHTCSYHESDKENGEKDYKRSSQVRSNLERERGQLLIKEMSRVKGKNRVSSGRGKIDQSFCDLDHNVRSKLSAYVDLCKSAKFFLMKGSSDVYGVSSTSIPFSDQSDFRRP